MAVRYKIITVYREGDHHSTTLEGYAAENLADQHFKAITTSHHKGMLFACIHETYENGSFGVRAHFVAELNQGKE